AGGVGGQVRMYRRGDDGRWTTLRTMMTPGDQRVRVVRFSPDGRTLASAGDDKAVTLWDAADGRLLASLPGHARLIYGLDFHPSGTYIVSGAEDGTIRIWPLRASSSEGTLEPAGEPRVINTGAQVLDLRFSPDGTRMITSVRDGEVVLWDTATFQRVKGFKPEASPWHIAFSHDGTRIGAGAWSQTGHVWGIADGVEVGPLRGHS